MTVIHPLLRNLTALAPLAVVLGALHAATGSATLWMLGIFVFMTSVMLFGSSHSSARTPRKRSTAVAGTALAAASQAAR